jgi:membrane fusion protein, multidrug efflux system
MRVITLLIGLLVIAGGTAQAQQPSPPAVSVVTVEASDVTPFSSFTGRIEAIDKVELIARVDGFLEERPFTEGAVVQQGDLLFSIEKGPYLASLGEVDADIAAAQAELTLARLEVDRQTTLVQRQAAAQAVLDQATALAGKSEADLLRAQSSRARAELDLDYTEIRAPITGRIGRAAASVGDYVNPELGPLATIVSEDPIYITFPVTQRQLLTFRESATSRGDTSTLAVKVRMADGRMYDRVGTIDFVDVQVDTGTDTVTVRAVVENPDGVLIDQQLVTVVVESAEPTTALLVPQAATLADQGGRYVLVVGEGNTVEARPITVGTTIDGNYVVTSGLEAGERVITDGIQRVRPGMVVDPAPAAGS